MAAGLDSLVATVLRLSVASQSALTVSPLTAVVLVSLRHRGNWVPFTVYLHSQLQFAQSR